MITEQVDAGKDKLDAAAALARAGQADAIWVVRGKKVLRFDMKRDPPGDDELLAVILGRSGTLRAPTIVSGKKMLVGFNPEALAEVLA